MHEIILKSVCEKDGRVQFTVYVNWLLHNVTATIESSLPIRQVSKDKCDILYKDMHSGFSGQGIADRIFNMVRGMWQRMYKENLKDERALNPKSK